MAYRPTQSRSKSKYEPQEPNLIPIMNLFIVIIPMLMTIIVSVRLAMVQITLSAPPAEDEQGQGGGGGEEQNEEDLPKAITLGLLQDRFEIRVEGENDVLQISKLENGQYDWLTLDENIARLKEEHEDQNVIEVVPDPLVKFDTLLRSIDVCKTNDFPAIKYKTVETKYYRAGQ